MPSTRLTPNGRRVAAVLVLIFALSVTPGPAPATETHQGALTVLDVASIDDRLQEVTVHSPALGRATAFRVLLPTGYDPAADVDYPVLYLLQGCCDSYLAWTRETDVVDLTADLDLVVVMPDAGKGGWYTDWVDHPSGAPPAWEDFHIGELVPWIDATYDVRAAPEGRALAGLSMGGFGALTYAARHPDLFLATAAFSGAVNSNVDDGYYEEQYGAGDGGRPGDMFGDRRSDEVLWRARNPWDLAANLATVDVTLRTNNGRTGFGIDQVELWCWAQMTTVHTRLDQLGIDHTWQDYGNGGHSWANWQRDLHDTLPRFMSLFSDPPAAPTSFRHERVEREYAVFDWEVSMHRQVHEWSVLDVTDTRQFSVSGSGQATVTTPSAYEPGVTYTAVAGIVGAEVVAGADGRLTISVDLGPSNTAQAHTPAAVLSAQRTVAVTVYDN